MADDTCRHIIDRRDQGAAPSDSVIMSRCRFRRQRTSVVALLDGALEVSFRQFSAVF
jgi:hypothetical protein